MKQLHAEESAELWVFFTYTDVYITRNPSSMLIRGKVSSKGTKNDSAHFERISTHS